MVSDLLKVTWLVQKGTDICTQGLTQLIFIWKTTFFGCEEADAGEPGLFPVFLHLAFPTWSSCLERLSTK